MSIIPEARKAAGRHAADRRRSGPEAGRQAEIARRDAAATTTRSGRKPAGRGDRAWRTRSISKSCTASIVPIAEPQPGNAARHRQDRGDQGSCSIEHDAGLVIVDHPLTPVQQRNLEKEWNAKVIDRTGLILEIFGRRASTKGRHAAGRSCASELPEGPAGPQLDPP